MNSFEQEKCFRVTRSPYASKRGRSFHAVQVEPETLRNLNYKHHYIIHISEHNSERLSLILAKGALVKLSVKKQYTRQIEHGGFLTVLLSNSMMLAVFLCLEEQHYRHQHQQQPI